MEINSEEDEENYSLLDQKRKEEIILQLKNEINDQIMINSKSKEEKNDLINTSDTNEIFKQINEKYSNDNNKTDENIYNPNLNYDSNLIFNEINNFIKDKNIYSNNNEESKENEKISFIEEQKEKIINKKNIDDKKINNDKNLKPNYLDKINNKKNLLFNKENKIPKLKSNNSFHETKKIQMKKNKSKNNITTLQKAKSTGKIKIKHKKNNSKSNKHQIIPNPKSKEKFKNIQIEIKNKFKEEHPFKPKINSNKNKIIKETKDERYTRLSRPKIFEIKGIHMIKTEETKLQEIDNKIIKKKSYNKIKVNQVSNRLYKLHQQIKEKKEQFKKIFEKKEMDKCSFNPEINNTSKKIMNKTYNNLSFNERNENYIKHKKESLMKLRKDIDEQINKNCSNINNNINNTNNKTKDEINVYDRLYENKYYSNLININLTPSDIDINKNTTKNHKNNTSEINDFIERQKIYELIKKERINKFKLEKNLNSNDDKDEYTFQPKINSTSDLIAKTNPERINEDVNDKYERLYNEAETIKNKKEQLSEFYNAQYNFTPQINEISKLIGNNYISRKNNGENMNNTLNKTKTVELNECTFKPKVLINEKFNSIESNYKFDENISKKIEEEISHRNNKISMLKSEYLSNNTKECKFYPETNKNIYNLKMHYNNNDNYYKSGLKKYKEQMNKAKKAKQEKEEREKKIFITGENWKGNNNLEFKPFNLSKNNNSKTIEEIRKELIKEEMKECSFHPVTNETRNKNIVKKILEDK